MSKTCDRIWCEAFECDTVETAGFVAFNIPIGLEEGEYGLWNATRSSKKWNKEQLKLKKKREALDKDKRYAKLVECYRDAEEKGEEYEMPITRVNSDLALTLFAR